MAFPKNGSISIFCKHIKSYIRNSLSFCSAHLLTVGFFHNLSYETVILWSPNSNKCFVLFYHIKPYFASISHDIVILFQ